MRDNQKRRSAPNYTNACIVMFGVNLVWVFLVVWAIWGLVGVAATGWALNLLIRRIELSRT